MDDSHLLENVLAYLLAAVVAVPIFRRLGLGAILGYLTAGALIGPHALNLVSDPNDALHFAEFGVIMLLFVIGLELAPEKLWRMKHQIIFFGGGQLLISALLLGLLFYIAAGLSAKMSVVLGLTLGLSSTAFAIQLMAERGILARPIGRRGFSVLLMQDMAVIPILILVQILAGAAADPEQNMLTTGVRLGVTVAALIIASRYLLNPVLRLIALYGSREVMTAAALLIVLGTAVLAEQVGLSMGLGAFLAGIMLANSSFRHQLETDIEPFKGLLLGLFFIAVGMTLDLQLLWDQPLFLLACAVLLMAIKVAVILGLTLAFRAPWREGIMLGLILSQGGEFAFVVLKQAVGLDFIPYSISDQVSLVVGLSMALTAPLVVLWGKFCKGKEEQTTKRDYDSAGGDEPEVIIIGFGRFGQIIGRILSANRIPFTALDGSASHVDFVARFGNKVFYGDGKRMDLLEAAGIKHASVLVVCVNSDESPAIVALVKEHFPHVRIIARAVNRVHAYELHSLGVHHVFREYFSSGLEAARATLSAIGFAEEQAYAKAEKFRQHDEDLIQRAIAHKSDQNKLIEIAKQGRAELESIFDQDENLRDDN